MRRELFVIMRKTLEPLIMTEALHLSNHARSARVGSRIPTVATWFFAIFLLLVGCSTDDPEYVESPVADIYNNALNALFDGNAAIAAKEFDEVERQHPYSVWATKAQIMSAYSYYLSNQYDEAILTFERYLQLHPGAKEAAYARYMIAICNYEQISDVGRDQKFTRQALDSLRIVTKRYPKSEYARDAKLKIDLTLDHLAGKEMEIGRFLFAPRHLYRGPKAVPLRHRALPDDLSHTGSAASYDRELLAAWHLRRGPECGRHAGLQFPWQQMVSAQLCTAHRSATGTGRQGGILACANLEIDLLRQQAAMVDLA